MFSEPIQQLVIRFQTQKPSSNFKRWEPDLYNRLLVETNFLPIKASLRQRLWHIQNNTTDIPNCKMCNLPVKWDIDTACYRTFCSSRCSNKNIETISKRENTMVEKYNTKHYTTSPDFNSKRIKTNQITYGVDWATQLPSIQQKIRKTCLDRYDTSYYTQSEDYKQKTLKSVQSKYGVDYINQRHIPNSILTLLQNKEWLYEQHYDKQRTITDISQELMVDTTTIVSYLKTHNLQVQRFENSLPEREIKQFLTELGIQTITNDRSIITPKELDIYLPDYNLAIEYCGLYWHSTIHPRIHRNYHKEKLIKCNDKNIRLITVFEDEWLHKSNIVKNKLINILNKTTTNKIHARKCNIINVSLLTRNNFYDTYHIQGTGPGSINIGLEYNNELVACMSFIQHTNNVFILNRYATSTNIPGGFSKLLSYFKRNYSWNKIISFADLRWSQGKLYERNGFTLDKILPPDYEYVNLKNMSRIHKFNFRHKHLLRLLGESYNPNISETENTMANNWYKIYNCGLLRYTLIK